MDSSSVLPDVGSSEKEFNLFSLYKNAHNPNFGKKAIKPKIAAFVHKHRSPKLRIKHLPK